MANPAAQAVLDLTGCSGIPPKSTSWPATRA